MITFLSLHPQGRAVTYGAVTLSANSAAPDITAGQCHASELRGHLEPYSHGQLCTHDTNVLQGLHFAHDSHPMMRVARAAAQQLDPSVPDWRPDRATRLWIHAGPDWSLSCAEVTVPLRDPAQVTQALRASGRTDVETDAILRGAQRQARVWMARSDKSKCLDVGKLIMQATAEDHAEHARALLRLASSGPEIPNAEQLLERLQTRPLHARGRAWPLHTLGDWTDQEAALRAAQELAAAGRIVLTRAHTGPAARLA